MEIYGIMDCMMKIVQKENSILRGIAKSIPLDEIRAPEIVKILRDMKSALGKEKDGVAIAAPQIGISRRIFVVSGKVLGVAEVSEFEKTGHNIPLKDDDMVFINPKLLKVSKKKAMMEEGCLSVRWKYGDVKRSTNATIEAYDENGEKFTRGAGGLLAQIFQHEIDHLNGILFIDKAKNIEDIPPPKK